MNGPVALFGALAWGIGFGALAGLISSSLKGGKEGGEGVIFQ